MAKHTKPGQLSFYFVLYLVAIVTVFVTIVERDDLLRKRDDNIVELIQLYVRPLRLTASVDTAIFFADPARGLAIDSLRIRVKSEGPLERSDISYSLVGIARAGKDETFPSSPAVRFENDHGDGVLTTIPLPEGVYAVTVAGYKKRIAREGNTMTLVIRDSVYTLDYAPQLERVDRDTVVLIAKVVKNGTEPLPLALNIEESSERWVMGVPFRKKIFISGVVDPRRVIFRGDAAVTFEQSAGAGNAVMMVWDHPSAGKKIFTVEADAKRGLGRRDAASTTFSVEVRPPSFLNPPAASGYWGIPYTFDGQIAGLNPIDLTVETSHDGRVLEAKGESEKVRVTPERGWTSLVFRVFYRGGVIKEHHASVFAPPPPQIKFLQQNLDRAAGLFSIQVTASDPVGGPIRMMLDAQPQGIATLDKIRGNAFTISVRLDGKPGSVFVKLTAADQFGGLTVSSKQYVIPQ